jgi:hypothetical protein
VSYQYATLFHGRPLVNGFSGYETPLEASLVGTLAPSPDETQFREGLRNLRALGVRYVIAHPGDFGTPSESTWTLGALRNSKQIVSETPLLGVSAFELAP